MKNIIDEEFFEYLELRGVKPNLIKDFKKSNNFESFFGDISENEVKAFTIIRKLMQRKTKEVMLEINSDWDEIDLTTNYKVTNVHFDIL